MLRTIVTDTSLGENELSQRDASCLSLYRPEGQGSTGDNVSVHPTSFKMFPLFLCSLKPCWSSFRLPGTTCKCTALRTLECGVHIFLPVIAKKFVEGQHKPTGGTTRHALFLPLSLSLSRFARKLSYRKLYMGRKRTETIHPPTAIKANKKKRTDGGSTELRL